jgi:hypothetical protein
MKYIVLGLSLVQLAAAQMGVVVLGASFAARPGSSLTTTSATVTGSSSMTNNQYNPQYTPPPSGGSAYVYTQVMPYSSMINGGYKDLQCGYGYYKDSNGSCSKESWVSIFAA